MHTWSEMGSTVAVVKNVAKAKGIDASSLNGQDIFDHYHDDPIYEKYVDQYYYVLANGIYNLQYAYDPQKIVIGGGISARSDLLDEVNQRLDVIFKTFTPVSYTHLDVYKRQVHNDPEHALCDGPQSLKPEKYTELLKMCIRDRY